MPLTEGDALVAVMEKALEAEVTFCDYIETVTDNAVLKRKLGSLLTTLQALNNDVIARVRG